MSQKKDEVKRVRGAADVQVVDPCQQLDVSLKAYERMDAYLNKKKARLAALGSEHAKLKSVKILRAMVRPGRTGGFILSR